MLKMILNERHHLMASEGTSLFTRMNMYMRGTCLYHVAIATQNLDGPNKVDVVRFFSSFRLL